MTSAVSNSQDVIDSRDVIERIEELAAKEEAIADATSEAESAEDEDKEAAQEALDDAEDDFDEDEREELKTLRALAEEAEGYAEDWRHGAALIRESYFTEYCRDLVSDIGDMPREIPSYIVIDWDATADNLRADYTEVDFDGVTYLVR